MRRSSPGVWQTSSCTSCDCTGPENAGKSLIEIGNDVFGRFKSNGKPDQAIGDAEAVALLFGNVAMGGGGGGSNQSLYASQALRTRTDFKSVHHGKAVFRARLQFKRKHSSRSLLLLVCQC